VKALVIYGTRWGGTTVIAQKISEVLKQEGYDVDVADAKKQKPQIISYDLIIIGSGIRADKWTRHTVNFLEKNAELLRTKNTALFVSCQMADREPQAREKAESMYLQKTAEAYELKPLSYGFFGGFLDFRKSHGLFVDVLVRVNRRSLLKNGLDVYTVYDKRDWNQIEAWTRKLAKTASNKQ